MKIISWNVNGLRAVYRRDFLKILKELNADFVCLQEIKIQKEKLPEELLKIDGYFSFFNFAQKAGYSGTAIYTKKKPTLVIQKLGHDRFDSEGRFLQLKYPNFSLTNFYFPHGGREKENLGYKLKAYKKFFQLLKESDKNMILVGDFNIAHEEIDLARPRQNLNNIMFTLKEREQIDAIINHGFKDTFRNFNHQNGNYTWWPYMANARFRNIGWRIDYVFVSIELSEKVKRAFILKDIFGSDHCPVGIEIDI